MNKYLTFAATLTFILTQSVVHAISFDLESLSAGTFTSVSETQSGLTMTVSRSGGDSFNVTDISSFFSAGGAAPASFGTRTLGFPSSAQSFVLDFSAGIYSLGAAFGDFAADSDSSVVMTAFTGLGGTGSSVDTSSENWAATAHFADTLGGPGSIGVSSGTSFRSVVLTSSSSGSFPNTLYWDNFSASTTVPDTGTTVALLGLAMAGLAVVRRRIA